MLDLDQCHAELTYHAYIVYGGMDKDLADAVASGLRSNGRSSLLSPDALFARDKEGFLDLEKQVCQCHTAVVVLSDALLAQFDLEPQRDRVKPILEILKSRTGQLIAVCRSEATLQRATEWGFDKCIDAVGWAGESNLIPATVILQLKNAIAACCPVDSVRAVGLPFVVVAMTRSEAEALAQQGETLFQAKLAPEIAEQFRELMAEFTLKLKIDLTAHAQHYGVAREVWNPFPGSSRSVGEMIQDIVARLNVNTSSRLRGWVIKAQFYSFDALLAGQEGPQYEIYRGLARTGCVVVIDEISMLHPTILNAFVQSPLHNSQQAAVVTISPFDPYGLGPDTMIEKVVRKQLGEAISRFGEDFDPQCEFGIGSERRLKRWLFSSLPGALNAVLNPPVDPLKMDKFTRDVGHQPQPTLPAFLEGGAP